MEQNDLVATGVLVVFGLIAGYFASQAVLERETLHGGPLARILNYLASGLAISVTPTVLMMVLVIHPEYVEIAGFSVAPLVQILSIAVAMMFLAYLLTIPLAMVEKPALRRIKQQEDAGWTEEDARTSGL